MSLLSSLVMLTPIVYSSDEGDGSEDIESDDDEPEDEYDRAIQREEKRLFEILAKDPQFPICTKADSE